MSIQLLFYANQPTLKNLTLTKVCLLKFKDLDFCKNTSDPIIGKDDFVQTNTSHWELYLTIARFLPAVLVTLYAGSWGDKFGRKFPLLIPPLGLAVASLGYVFFDLHIERFPLWTLVLSQFATGITGGELVMISASLSYLVVVFDVESRIQRISILQAMVLIGSSIGPSISGVLRDIYGDYAVFIMTGIISVLIFVYTILVLKNIQPVGGGVSFTLKNAFDLNHVKDSVLVIIKPRTKGRRNLVLTIVGMSGFYFFNISNEPLSWDYTQFTTWSTVTRGLSGLCLLVVLPIARHFFQFKDTAIGIVSTGADVIYFVIMGFASKTWIVYAASVFYVMENFTAVSFRSVMARIIRKDEEGKVFSFLAIIENLSFILSASFVNELWPLTRKFFKGTLLEVAAFFGIIVTVIMIYIHKKVKEVENNSKSIPCKELQNMDEKALEIK
ncbi:Proton-coupled folate transporter [Nymphon striatum]|nr:Proton-coupled folate transporter [Nymphon striatum]